MKVSIITINYNDAAGLQRTLDSVCQQIYTDYELIVVDGASIDGSVDVIRSIVKKLEGIKVKWVSEPDNGVYDAQNKGIEMAMGEYCLFLNGGDVFCDENVLERIWGNKERKARSKDADIIYGNERAVKDGVQVGYCKGVENPTFLDLYKSCMKHQATFIRRELFDKYGKYDATMKISADWDWFFRVIAFHDDVTLQYVDVDVADFEEGGISSGFAELNEKENKNIRNRYMSKRLQEDYVVFAKYQNLRYIDKNRYLIFLQRMIGKIGKMIYRSEGH